MRLQYVGFPYLRTLGLMHGTIQPEGIEFDVRHRHGRAALPPRARRGGA